VHSSRLADETIYQRLKRFVQFDWADQQSMMARFVLGFFRDQDDLVLIPDCTNWMWGQRDLNLLILSVRWKSFRFPLAWTVLPQGGSSSSAARIALLASVVASLHGKRLALLADREFIGQDWFLALQRLGINRAIRLQATTRVNGSEVRACF